MKCIGTKCLSQAALKILMFFILHYVFERKQYSMFCYTFWSISVGIIRIFDVTRLISCDTLVHGVWEMLSLKKSQRKKSKNSKAMGKSWPMHRDSSSKPWIWHFFIQYVSCCSAITWRGSIVLKNSICRQIEKLWKKIFIQ